MFWCVVHIMTDNTTTLSWHKLLRFVLRYWHFTLCAVWVRTAARATTFLRRLFRCDWLACWYWTAAKSSQATALLWIAGGLPIFSKQLSCFMISKYSALIHAREHCTLLWAYSAAIKRAFYNFHDSMSAVGLVWTRPFRPSSCRLKSKLFVVILYDTHVYIHRMQVSARNSIPVLRKVGLNMKLSCTGQTAVFVAANANQSDVLIRCTYFDGQHNNT